MNSMKTKTTDEQVGAAVIRQGDVMLVRLARLPVGAKRRRVAGDRVILALGEATGHHHSVAKKKARLWEAPGRPGTEQATIVEVAAALAELEHQEHDSIPLARGFYEVRLQREYTPEAIRRVAD